MNSFTSWVKGWSRLIEIENTTVTIKGIGEGGPFKTTITTTLGPSKFGMLPYDGHSGTIRMGLDGLYVDDRLVVKGARTITCLDSVACIKPTALIALIAIDSFLFGVITATMLRYISM